MPRYVCSALFALSLLSGCGAGDWVNTHLPVIGERCENWQCVTSSGQEESRLHREQRLRPQGNPVPSDASAAATPTPAAAPAAAPLAPSTPDTPTYQYVPRQPLPPGDSPFDGQPAPAAEP